MNGCLNAPLCWFFAQSKLNLHQLHFFVKDINAITMRSILLGHTRIIACVIFHVFIEPALFVAVIRGLMPAGGRESRPSPAACLLPIKSGDVPRWMTAGKWGVKLKNLSVMVKARAKQQPIVSWKPKNRSKHAERRFKREKNNSCETRKWNLFSY